MEKSNENNDTIEKLFNFIKNYETYKSNENLSWVQSFIIELDKYIYEIIITANHFWKSDLIRKGSIDGIFKQRIIPENKEQTFKALETFIKTNKISPGGENLSEKIETYKAKTSIAQKIMAKQKLNTKTDLNEKGKEQEIQSNSNSNSEIKSEKDVKQNLNSVLQQN